MRRLAQFQILEPEDPSSLSVFELRFRRVLSVGYRVAVAVFVTSHLFDFLFSSVWMHGYIWSLNLPIDLDMSDKSAGAIVYHQLEQVGQGERLILMVSKVCAIALFLIFTGFGGPDPQSVWTLLRLSAFVGVLGSLVRSLQLKQRFFSSIHEGFYCYLVTFMVGLILTVRPLERLPISPVNLQNANRNEVLTTCQDSTTFSLTQQNITEFDMHGNNFNLKTKND